MRSDAFSLLRFDGGAAATAAILAAAADIVYPINWPVSSCRSNLSYRFALNIEMSWSFQKSNCKDIHHLMLVQLCSFNRSSIFVMSLDVWHLVTMEQFHTII